MTCARCHRHDISAIARNELTHVKCGLQVKKEDGVANELGSPVKRRVSANMINESDDSD